MVVVNGKPVIVDQVFLGITGSAIDSDEAALGTIRLQGEEYPLSRRISQYYDQATDVTQMIRTTQSCYKAHQAILTMNSGRPRRRAGWSRSLHRSLCVLFSYSITTLIPTIYARAQRTPPPPIMGPLSSEARIARWDLTVSNGREKHSAWLEVERSGYQSLVGRFVGQIGGARPIGKHRVERWRGAF